MAFFTTSSRRPPATLYPPSNFQTPADILPYTQNTASPAPESPVLTVGPRPPLRYDSNNDSVGRPQLLLEPNKKRHIESVGESGGGSFPTSSSKRPRTLNRPKNAVRETPGFACPLYKRNPSKFGGPRGCADWCTLEIHRLYSDHLKKHSKEGDISYETLDAVKKLKPCVKDSFPEAKAAERWSLTYRYLHKLSSGDKIPSSYYQRRELSFEKSSQHFTPGPESSELSRYEPEQQDKGGRTPLSLAAGNGHQVKDGHSTTDAVYYPLLENIRGANARLTKSDQVEIDILQQRGAFLLPPRALCDELVECFFKWVAPVVPVISRSRFMRQYRYTKNGPSVLLLQAILLAGSRVCTNPQLMDANGSTTAAAMTFYKRAKALFEANYEDDRITIVQALLLIGWSDIAPDVTKNAFYWTRVAGIVTQESGMHRSVENSQLSRADKRLWKRVWRTLFTRDRSVAVALGRPLMINTDDADVEMISEDDFIEDDTEAPAEYEYSSVHVQFFLQYVKLCEIMGLVFSQQYSVASKARRTNSIDLTHSDMALADWLQNCPQEVFWARSRHHFWSAFLHLNYFVLHNLVPATSR